MGRGSYGNPLVHVFPGDTASIRVGQFASIGPGVEFIIGGEHHVEWVSTFPFRARYDLPGAFQDGHPASRGDIVVGNDVWIGTKALILSGAQIGDGAVIGAGAVITGAVRPYAVVVGNPCREIRRRFSDDVVDALLDLRWWDWPMETILERVDRLCGSDTGALIRGAE